MSGGGGGGGRGGAFANRRGPQGRATPQQHFGSFGSTPGGGQPDSGLPKATPADSPRFSGRYERSAGTMRPATAGNIATALAGALPAGGLIQSGIAALKGTPTDPYSGPSKPSTNFSQQGVGTETTGQFRIQRRPRAQRRTGLGGAPGGQTLG